jgi:hypothetical protein
VAINEQLQQEAQAVLDVIENPDVAQALRQDKNQNLTYLKDNYGVSEDVLYGLNILTPTICPSFIAAHPRTNYSVIQLWEISVHVRELFWRRRLPLPLSRTFHRHRFEHLSALGQTRLGHPHGEMGRGTRGAQHAARNARCARRRCPDHFLRSGGNTLLTRGTTARYPTLPHLARALVPLCIFQPPSRSHPSPRNIPLTRLSQHHPIRRTLGPALPRRRRRPLPQVAGDERSSGDPRELARAARNTGGCQGCAVGRVSVFGPGHQVSQGTLRRVRFRGRAASTAARGTRRRE